MKQGVWQEFSTETVAPPLRARRWADFGSETLSEMNVKPLDGHGNFRATMKRRNLGPLGFVVMESSPALACSSAAQAGAWAGDGSDYLMMTVADRGRSTLRQSTWSADLCTGDIVIRDLSKPWESHSDEGMGLILIKVPYSLAARHHVDPERLVGRHLPVTDSRVAFASTVIRAGRQALEADPDADWHESLSDVLAGVFRLICQDDPGFDALGEGRSSSKLRRSAMTFILRHLHDPDLSVALAAEALGVTTRHLQRAFMEAGVTPRQFILEQRLSEAASMLLRCNGAEADRIIDIAFTVGFNDASHFTRSFVQKYGCSPRIFRTRKDT
jgi:AraC-like DNA-binding protein